jgi:phospholipase C
MHPRHGLRVLAPLLLVTLACSSVSQLLPPTPSPAPLAPPASPTPVPTSPPPSEPTVHPTATAAATETPKPLVPAFKHIVTVVFENKEFGTVIGNAQMPYFNELAKTYTLLTQHYAVAHPSLPNYLALIGGDTFGVTFTCTKCIFDAETLPDLIEASGRTWKTYQEDMPSPCYTGAEAGDYAMKHNPFMYFDSIRLDSARCTSSVVPMQQLYVDLAGGNLPNYSFITPNLCNDAHDCGLGTADDWLQRLMSIMLPLLGRDGTPYLVIVTWDEGQGNHSCCGLPAEAGGRIATILVSPQAKSGFEDETPYTHYSILKTISEAWQLKYLGHAADADNVLITAPWK